MHSIAHGTCNVIDVSIIAVTEDTRAVDALRARPGIPLGAPVAGFVGRFTRDKGIAELLDAYKLLKRHTPELRLLLIGDFEEGDPVPASVRDEMLIATSIPGFVSIRHRIIR